MFLKQRTPFQRVLQLMVAYYLLSVGFNVISLLRQALGNPPLIEGKPLASIIMLTLFLVLAYCGHKQWRWPFISIGIFGVLALPMRGIFPHITALFDPAKQAIYVSEFVIWIALAINLFGFCVLVLGFCYAPFLRKAKETL